MKEKKTKKEVKAYNIILPNGVVKRDAKTTTKEELDVMRKKGYKIEEVF